MVKLINIRNLLPLFLLVGAFFAISSVGHVSAAPADSGLTKTQAIRICNIKIQKQACLNRIEQCKPAYASTCLSKKVAVGDAVLAVCRDNANPQACQQRVTSQCKSTPQDPLSGDALKNCQSQAADGTGGGSPGGGAAGGAAQKAADISLAAPRETKDTCGEGKNAVTMSIDFGCTGKGNPIVDLAYALIRFLSYGVGLVVVASIILAGIQYSSSSGNPEQTSAAKKRILNAFIALIFYLLIWAFIQFLVPGGLFN